MSKSRNMADLLDSNGDVKSGALDNVVIPQVDDEVAIGATAPSSPFEGQLWYDVSGSVSILKAYNGTEWTKVSPVIPTITSISGSIYETIGGNITITGTGFLSGNCDVEFSGSFTTTIVTQLASSDTSLVVAVPAAAYASTGTVTVKVTNGDNGQSPSDTFSVLGLPTGGTVTTSGDYRIHTFTSSSSFVVPSGLTLSDVEYVVVAGGGAGGSGGDGWHAGGGGGAGGYRASVTGESSGGGASAESKLTLTAGSYAVTVGAGGTVSQTTNADGGNGSNSVFAAVTSIGGGGGSAGQDYQTSASGGSGGGSGFGCTGGSGTSGQGYRGGNAPDNVSSSYRTAAGGGGAAAQGVDRAASDTFGTNGGIGVSSSITGSATYRAGGGGGGFGGGSSVSSSSSSSSGGSGGGGNGGAYLTSGSAGTANTGGGGGGAGNQRYGANGGSGIVIVRYAI
jgi:hypothetical protein